MGRMLRSIVAVVVVAAAVSCASAPIKTAPVPPPVDLAKADALVAEGCYDCLSEARDLFQQGVTDPRVKAQALPRLFETTVLLGLREKELALNPQARFDAAKALIPELPPAYSAAEYLEIASYILPDGQGTPGREMALFKRPDNASLEKWKVSLASGEGGQWFRRYLSVGLDCVAGRVIVPQVPRIPGAPAAPPTPPPPPPAPGTEPPLVVYRRAECPRIDRVLLGGIAEADPRFIEAGVFSTRTRSRQPNGKEIADARAYLTTGNAKWPESTAVTYALGALNQFVGDCTAALKFYNRTLELKPLHEDAHLGRLVCMSYLRQHVPAVTEATGMISDKNNQGEATYWRAWNKRELKQLPEARVDSDRMKQILYHDRAMLLAGQIEYDLNDLDIAEKDLNAALALNSQNCIVPWYLGLVKLKREAWASTAQAFVTAMECYQGAVAYDRVKLEEMKVADVDESFRAVQIAGFEAAIGDDSSQVSASAFNAAVNYARANDRQKALEFCDLAAKDPDRATQAAELRALIIKHAQLTGWPPKSR